MSKLKTWIHDEGGREIPVFIFLEHGAVTLSFKNAKTGQMIGEIYTYYKDGNVRVNISDENAITRDLDPAEVVLVPSAAVRLVKIDGQT